MANWNGVPGGGLPAGAATSMTNLGTESNPVWGWAGAERVNSHMAAAMPGRAVTAKAQPCDEIMEKLFLGTKACASSPVELKKRSIGLTIGIGNNLKLDGDEVMRADFQFEDEESGSLLVHFPKAFTKIREGLEEDGGVLLFCETGQASTALVAAFLMAEKGMTYEEATGLISEKRQNTDLNRNLSRQLKTWAKWPEFPGLPEWM